MDLAEGVVARARQRVGSTVNGMYRLDTLLGVGGMGAVFAATATDGRRVAVKTLHTEFSRMPSVQARFFREAYAANSIPHPGVARVFEHGTDESGGAFLVMELLEGETLEGLWERNKLRLGVGHVLAITERLLEVLAVAHATGLVHRDVKPDNIFLTGGGDLKVLDFGIARLLDGSGATASGEMMGTPAFMPPEQASGQSRTADVRSDVWSVGAVMFTMISGRHVHEAPNQPLQLIYAATQPSRSLEAVAPYAPRDVVVLVDRALRFDREARWESAGAMLAALHMVSLEGSAPTVEVAAVSPPQSGATVVMERGPFSGPPGPDEREDHVAGMEPGGAPRSRGLSRSRR